MASKIKSKLGSLSTTKKSCLCCCIIMITLFAITGFMVSFVRMEIVSDVKTVNPEGTTGRAFVVYRPGISSFQKDATDAFIEGLSDNGWSIDVTTASSQTPTDLRNYDLLVIGSPTYGGTPHQSVMDYLERVGNLNKKKTAIIVTSGNSDGALIILENEVTQANGVIVSSLSLYLVADNGRNAREISYQAGTSIKA